MSLQAKVSAAGPLGIYLHVPFCSHACDFCAFYQEVPRRGDIDRYLDGIARECRLVAACQETAPHLGHAETMFWGGGTPGLLPAKDLRRLGETVLAHLPSAPAEWTVEMAPSAVKPDKIEALRALGVTRISLGVQSFDDGLLDKLGRQHNRRQIERAWAALCESGFANINLDLMFALPGQTRAQWLADLREAMHLSPEHISTYCLTFEEDTALWVKLSEGKVRRDIPQEAEFYELTWETLEAGGYAQYEISNFARPGRQCIHNLNTWRMHHWLGLGPSAASQFGGHRFQNPASLDRWLVGVDAGEPVREEVVELTQDILATDALIFGLRMNEGVDLRELQQRFSGVNFQFFQQWADGLSNEGLLQQSAGRIILTHQGRLLADRVGESLLAMA